MSNRRPSWRTTGAIDLMVTGVVGALTLAVFTWPFLIDSPSALEHGDDLPWLFPGVLALVAAALLAGLTRGGLDAKRVATLGTLIALGAALRVLSAGTAGIEPMFCVIVLGGRVLGPTGGVLVGSGSVLTGAFLTAGVGPWLPYQMLACAAVGWGAGLLPAVPARIERWLLAGYGLVSGLLFGAVMNLWFWPFLGDGAPAGADFVPGAGLTDKLRHYGAFYVLTSLGWDLTRGVTNALVLAIAGPRLLRVLHRAVARVGFSAAVRFDGPRPAAGGQTGPDQAPAD